MSGIVAFVSLASAGTVTDRSDVNPRSSCGRTSSRSCSMNGRLASTVGPVETTPGVSVRASWRSGGNAAFSALNAGIAVDSVRGSSAIERCNAPLWRANDSAVVLKSVIRFCRFCGWASIAPATGPCSAIQFDRSWGWMPSAS